MYGAPRGVARYWPLLVAGGVRAAWGGVGLRDSTMLMSAHMHQATSAKAAAWCLSIHARTAPTLNAVIPADNFTGCGNVPPGWQ